MTDRPLVPDRSLGSRFMVGVVGAPALLWLFWNGGYPLFALLALIVLVGQAELFGMQERGIPLVHRIIAHAAGIAILADAFLHRGSHGGIVTAAALIGFFLAEMCTAENEHRLGRVTFPLFAAVYPAAFLAFVPMTASYPVPLTAAGNRMLPLFVLVVIWLFDIASYFAGTFFGKRPLFPAVSPHKTWEGLAGGLAGALAAGAVFSFAGGIPLIHALAAAFVVSLAGLAGDYAESVVKRGTGVKDSSRILGGHGGVLDRFDSFFFAAPAAYCYLLVVSAVRGCQ